MKKVFSVILCLTMVVTTMTDSLEYFAPAEPPIRFIAPPVRGMDPLES